ncbi:MAG TPA: M23 family metallopeptidase [Anaerolineales bacterium]|nr:M23 family metallopeptidase [Anaerolineales bacterium]
MKQFIFFLLSIFLLTSCTPAVQTAVAQQASTSTETPFVISTPEAPASTSISPSPTAMQIPCDPYSVDYCITDGHFIFQNPIRPPGNTFVDTTYRYGSTQNEMREPHHGVEFSNKFGTPVHAAGDGVVLFAGPDNDSVYSPWKGFYGNVIVIGHVNEMYTLYAHLSKVNVQMGDIVFVGDQIGEVGDSGVATGSHLHFEVRYGGDGVNYFSTKNPELWVEPNQGENGEAFGVISFSVEDQDGRFQFVDFTARYHQDKNGPKIKSHYVVTYAKDMMNGEENAALGDLPPGYYRVALKHNGHLYEKWVEVESGKLTQVVFVVN